MNTRLSTQKIKDIAMGKGADIIGIADLRLLSVVMNSPITLLQNVYYRKKSSRL